jgi:hypothetical protein
MDITQLGEENGEPEKAESVINPERGGHFAAAEIATSHEYENVTENAEIVDKIGENHAAVEEDEKEPEPEEDEEETVKEENTEHNTDTEKPETMIKQEYGADLDNTAAGIKELTDEEWRNLWFEAGDNTNALDTFFNHLYTWQGLLENEIPKKSIEAAYEDAVSIAAVLEKMLNGKKYNAQ